MFLVVAHKIDETLELRRTAQHEEAAFLLDAAVFDLPLGPAGAWSTDEITVTAVT